MAKTSLHPFGRSLADFQPLTKAEEQLLAAVAQGTTAIIGSQRPPKGGPALTIRAGFIRFLALGGDASAPVHEHGVQVEGAWIEELLDLDGAKLPVRLSLVRCRLERIQAQDATVPHLRLDDTLIEEGIEAYGLSCTGDFAARGQFRCNGQINLIGAKIGGSLNGRGGTIRSTSGKALHADRLWIGGDLMLGEGFSAKGQICLIGAQIDGNVDCIRGSIAHLGNDAFQCDMATIGRHVLMRDFTSVGGLCFSNATIHGNLELDRARLNGGRISALNCCGMILKGSAYLRGGLRVRSAIRFIETRISGAFDLEGITLKGGSRDGLSFTFEGGSAEGTFNFVSVRRIDGQFVLGGAHVGTLHDDAASWNKVHGRTILDGFTYGRLAGKSPIDEAMRIRWLCGQMPALLRDSFRSRPWEQLIATLRGMGHPDLARRIAIEKQERLRAAGKIGPWARPFHWAYGKLTGYGYRAHRLALAMIAAWFCASMIYWVASDPATIGVAPSPAFMVTTKPAPKATCLSIEAPRLTFSECPSTAGGPAPFVAPIYALDVLLPVANLGYKADWRPSVAGHHGPRLFWAWMLMGVTWTFSLFGWLCGLLLVAVLGGLIRKD